MSNKKIYIVQRKANTTSGGVVWVDTFWTNTGCIRAHGYPKKVELTKAKEVLSWLEESEPDSIYRIWPELKG